MAKGIYISPNTFKPIQNPLTVEIAARSVTNGQIANFLNLLPDPDPVLRKLGRGIEVLKDLLSDDHVGSTVTRRKMGVKSLDWQITPGENNAQKEMELCEIALVHLNKKTKTKDLISQSLNPIFWGTSVFEIVWEKAGNYYLPKKVEEKPLNWFGYDYKNEIFYKGATGREKVYLTGDNVEPHIKYKFIVLRNEPTYENPFGDKALSRCFWPVSFKRGGLKFWATFVEKYGMPYLFGKLPRGAGEEQHNDLLSKLELMVMDGIGTMPDDSSIDKLDTAGSLNGEIYEKFINYCNNAISKAILTNTLSTELSGSTGSYAATESHRGVEYDLADMDKDFTTELFNMLFELIVDVNLGTKNYPSFDVFEEEDINKDLAERDKSLTEQGVKFTKKYFVNRYKFEEDEFEIGEIPQTQTANFAEPAQAKVNEPDVNLLPDKLLQMQIEKTLQPVLSLVKEGKSYEEVMGKLTSLYPDLSTNKLEDILTKLIFISETAGRVS